jgi:hypothetical protein
MVETVQGPFAIGRPPPIGVISPGLDPPPIEVVEDVSIEVVEVVTNRCRPMVDPVFGGAFPILGVVVPPPGHGFVPVHQIPQASSLPAVEVFEGDPFAIRGPGGEVLGRGEELIVGFGVDVECREEPPSIM